MSSYLFIYLKGTVKINNKKWFCIYIYMWLKICKFLKTRHFITDCSYFPFYILKLCKLAIFVLKSFCLLFVEFPYLLSLHFNFLSFFCQITSAASYCRVTEWICCWPPTISPIMTSRILSSPLPWRTGYQYYVPVFCYVFII